MSNLKLIFISDLHLSPSETLKTNIFLRFLKSNVGRSIHLFILGDLFDYWIGDDDRANPLFSMVVPALREFTNTGARLSVMHGNRDFLIGKSFSGLTRAQLLPDPFIIDIYGNRTLLSHGDQWCTDDIEYQAIRSMVRSDEWMDNFLRLTITERHQQAKNYRQKSETSKENKTTEIMDVSLSTVDQAFVTHDCQRIIHGHTHRHAHHRHFIDSQPMERFVLSDWHEHGQALFFSENGYSDECLT
jgi:UDP-2,3-diacylglucosamine hydrolase